MFDEIERVKERRRERLERIRHQSRESMASFEEEWNHSIGDPYIAGAYLDTTANKDEQLNRLPPQRRFGLQLFFSALLIGIAYLLFQTSLSFPDAWKETAYQVMTRDFNFSGVSKWYQARFGQLPTILPAFSPEKNALPVSTAPNLQDWQLPNSWKLVKPFEPNNPKVVMDVGATGEVVNSGTSWVAFVGEKPGYGKTVVLRLSKGREVWLGNMETVKVAENDFLKAGDVIGIAQTFDQASRYVFVTMKQQEHYVDPLDVGPLD
ncbi:M23 family metallopeptidase [Brevibacillus fulvus]|uniref:Stage IV sporulation protein FA n=1 Tax=Brevibacillus fulvus TaxID=1125967 RepID=A0A938XTW0_9BACL|nr:M23 family metallopeptidase [Brevibacillus fulvus]MBM7590017.1 stage IV sporulation protein FA [Brevibacillus fulvus]